MTPAETLIRRYLDCARAHDWEAAFAFFADDIAIRIPGRSPMAGEHRGREAAIRYIEKARALSREAEVELELIDVLAGQERVALLLRERFHTTAGEVEIRRANVYRVAGEQIVEIWVFEGDQYEVDELMSSAS